MPILSRGKIYIDASIYNALRDTEANLPGVPPDGHAHTTNILTKI